MSWLIIGIVVAVGLFIFLGLEEVGEGYNVSLKWILKRRQLYALFGLVICLFGFIARVPANHVGVVYSPFSGTQEKTLSEGTKIKNPLDKVYKFSTEVQTTTIENLTTQTKDAQFLNSMLDVKWYVNESNAYVVFKQFKSLNNVSKNLIQPTTQRVLELITTKYNVIDILGEKRTTVYTELEKSTH